MALFVDSIVSAHLRAAGNGRRVIDPWKVCDLNHGAAHANAQHVNVDRHKPLRPPRSAVAPLQKFDYVFQLFLWLSRARLGKMIGFIIRWCKRGVFAPHRSLPGRRGRQGTAEGLQRR